MIDKMEEVFDATKFPGTFLKPRTFGSVKRGTKKGHARGRETTGEAITPISFEDMAGAKSTFEITVRYRQNATWQGHILWIEKGLQQEFRCVLEMLKLIDEALTEGEILEAPVAWDE